MAAMDRSRFELVPIGIAKDGRWLMGGDPLRALAEEAARRRLTEGGADAATKHELLERAPPPTAGDRARAHGDHRGPAAGPARAARRRPGPPARPAGRGRDHPGPAAAGGRPVRGRGRARLRGRHGQGRDEGPLPRPRPCRSSSTPLVQRHDWRARARGDRRAASRARSASRASSSRRTSARASASARSRRPRIWPPPSTSPRATTAGSSWSAADPGPRGRGGGARQRRAAGLGARRGRLRRRVVRLRDQVRRRADHAQDPRAAAARGDRGGAGARARAPSGPSTARAWRGSTSSSRATAACS